MSASQEGLFGSSKQSNKLPSYTCTYNFYDDAHYFTYTECKEKIIAKMTSWNIPQDMIVFDDEKETIRFKVFSEQEIAYIFEIGYLVRTKETQRALAMDVKISLNVDYRSYLENKVKQLISGSKDFSKQYNFDESEKESQVIELGTSNTLASMYHLMPEEVAHVVIGENHKSPRGKLAIMSPDSIALLKQKKGIVLLEHLCSESMQTELDKSGEHQSLSPILEIYLRKLDKAHGIVNEDQGFYMLVKTLVENGIPVYAIDTQALYKETMDAHSNVVTEKRQMVNIEWKLKADEIRDKHPESLLVSLVGEGHTTFYINSVKPYSFPVCSYDQMVGGALWSIDNARHNTWACVQPEQLKFSLLPLRTEEEIKTMEALDALIKEHGQDINLITITGPSADGKITIHSQETQKQKYALRDDFFKKILHFDSPGNGVIENVSGRYIFHVKLVDLVNNEQIQLKCAELDSQQQNTFP
ncbi:hypothetical protein [Legionella maioricensis]|uniref:Uncharacterized protein n=1 Tax=Legionella maioricensis TaxID=2896528 RepID=A0A9X2D1U5_9GAMM|nr:hypothetical protein [Legionella maioricensis]MCL9684737.1 hypothetical protein [Legionella maioricensis]MCL9687765.1 hypothetical protein [Legionella maioricensis]